MSISEARHVYNGPERRHHRIFVTRNTEYHCRDDVCVAVRDLETGDFVADHAAIGRRLTGGIRYNPEGGVASFSRYGEKPHQGESLYFTDDSADFEVRTSGFCAIQRPPLKVVQQYRH